MAQGEDIVPIPGTKRRSYLEENVAAAESRSTGTTSDQIEPELPAAAGRPL
jgi:aryl-alcohol dehydrogenase-like predicted oxidoreductase